jgi:hypothetical protein
MPIPKALTLKTLTEEQKRMREYVVIVRNNLKDMNIGHIKKIYSDIDSDSYSIIYEFVENCNGRIIVKITEFNGEELSKPVYFFKSTGGSRINCHLENIWFPIGEFDNKNNCKNYDFDGSVTRIKKAEDSFIIADYKYLEKLIKAELDEDVGSSIDKIQLIKYMRFINKKYTIMSKLMYNAK